MIEIIKKIPTKLIFRLTISTVLLVIIFKSINFEILWQIVRAANIYLLLLSIILYIPGLLLAALRWDYSIKNFNISLPSGIVIYNTVLGQFSALLLPGQISGDVVRIVSISRGRSKKTTPLALSVFIDKMAFFIGVVGFLIIGLFGSGFITKYRSGYYVIIIITLSILLVFIGICRYRKDNIPGLLLQVRSRLPILERLISIIQEWLSLPRVSIETILIIIFLGFCGQLANIVNSYVRARAMHIEIDVIDWAVITTFIALIQVLPLTIGGLGIREGLFAGLLLNYNIPVEQSIAYSLLSYFTLVLFISTSMLVVELVRLYGR